jgi:phage-related minor tail protein
VSQLLGQAVPKGAGDKATGKASGGPVSGGSAYTVGERGPETFVPAGNGYIIPSGGTPEYVIVMDGEVVARLVDRRLARMANL